MATRSEQLADAMRAIAKTNHYMVGLTERVTVEELDAAEQIIISGQNMMLSKGYMYRRYDLALDLIEVERKRILQEA